MSPFIDNNDRKGLIMSSFIELSEKVLRENPNLTTQRLTVEKEIIHQDILRIMNEENCFKELTFMGGTCLRLCYGFSRLSEDLGFSSSVDFDYKKLESLEKAIKTGLGKKYGTDIEITRPEKDTDTDTWIIKVITNPEQSNIPSQKVHIDICHYPSYERQLRRINDTYGISSSQEQLFVYAESLNEILVDKIIALALRNRIKNRDLWDIMQLNEKLPSLNKNILECKLNDRGIDLKTFSQKYNSRMIELSNGFPNDFKQELERFISKESFEKSILLKEQGLSALLTILSDYSLAL